MKNQQRTRNKSLSIWRFTQFAILAIFSVLIISACQKNQMENMPKPETSAGDYNNFRFAYSPAPSSENMPIYTILDLELLEAISYSMPQNYLYELLEAIRQARQEGHPVAVFLGLEPVYNATQLGTPAFQIDPFVAERLSTEFRPYPETGMYNLVNLMIATSDDDQNLIDLNSTDVTEVTERATEGGICSVMAIAHSLIRNLGIVPTDGRGDWPDVKKTVDGQEVWDADFLKKIFDASGDDDDNRGFSNDEIEEAHTADYNDTWEIRESLERTKIMDEDDEPSAAELSAWCRNLKSFFAGNRNDDCLLHVFGTLTYTDDEGVERTKRVGHIMTITDVNEDADGNCDIKVVNTARQDSNGDFENVPFNPGEQEWEISTDGIEITRGNGWGDTIVWDEAYCWCFDEEPKRAGTASSDLGSPGTALED